MLVGNPAPFLAMAGSSSFRAGIVSFGVSLMLSARKAMAVPAAPRVADTSLPYFGASPMDTDFLKVRCFDEAFIPTSAPAQNGENGDLGKALETVVNDHADESLQGLEDFVLKYPGSRWILAVELNRGLTLYRRGYFFKALEAFKTAWAAGKDETNGAKKLADRALAELIRMDSRVGRMDDMKKWLDVLGPRKPDSIAARHFEEAKDSMWVMENQPGKAFFCGPLALRNILSFQHSSRARDPLFVSTQSPQKGFSLDQVLQLSQALGMNLQAARRAPGARVILPSVVHWKLDHYAALLEARNGMIRSVDPTFQNDTWLSEKALDVEGSGYFLVPDGPLPEGWSRVSLSEAQTVWGKGNVGNKAKPDPSCPAGAAGGAGMQKQNMGSSCQTCNSCKVGMPGVNIDLAEVAVMLFDQPIGYQPQVGPPIAFKLIYHQKTPSALFASNLGPNFSFLWQGYVQYDFNGCPAAAANYLLVPTGGGQEPISSLGSTTQFSRSVVSASQTFAGTACLDGLPSVFTRALPDGSKEIYGQAVTTLSQVKILLTQVVDPMGNAVDIHYDNSNRVTSITDSTGQNSIFEYNDTDSNHITRITDPFGRFASFQYDSNGRLSTLTDQLGLSTSLTYNPPSALSSDWLATMTTPYGTTTFDYTGSVLNGTRELEVTAPEGLKQHARFSQPQAPPDAGAPVPTGLSPPYQGSYTNLLQYRNTFYWDAKAMADAPLLTSSARIYHWLHTDEVSATQSNILESMKPPLESRVWYSYEGQDNEIVEAPGYNQLPLPSVTARIVVNAVGSQSTQLSQYRYNSLGKPITFIDPKGRDFSYSYSVDGLDLLSVKAGSSQIAAYAGYVNHQPSSYTDAAGKTWNYLYTTVGQLKQVTSPTGETTTYNYDGQNRLESIVPPQAGAGVTFTYDSLVTYRVHTRSDAVNGTLTYTYDNGDRVTKVDYPDGTHEDYGYNKLDLVSAKDRLQRETTYAFDSAQRLTDTTDPKSQTTHLAWCSCGSLNSITDPKGNHTTFDRDLEGRVIKKTYMDGSFYSYAYENTGTRMAFMTDAKQQITRYLYDLDDKLIGQDYFNAQNPTPNVAFDYTDPLGRLKTMTDGIGTHTYSYYTFGSTGGGKLQSINQPIGNTTANIVYVYDNDGRVTSRSIDGVAETYGFSNGQLLNVTNPLGSFGYTYDPSSARLTNVAYPNGQAVNFDYFTAVQNSGRLKTITNLGAGSTAGQTLSKFDYDYNPAGEITTWVQQLSNNSVDAKTYAMGYDQASQLQGVTMVSGTSPGMDGLTAGQAVTYGYDLAGNRTKEHAPSFDHSFSTNNLNQLTNETPNPIHVKGITNRSAAVSVNGSHVAADGSLGFETDIPPVGGTSTPLTVRAVATDGTVTTKKNHVLNTQPFLYDSNGDCVKDSERSYEWDSENRLVKVNILNPQPESVADNITFQYDGLGRRVGITEKHGSTILSDKRFVWCGNVQPCDERDSSGSTVTKRYFGQGFQIIGGVNAGFYFCSKDHLGSIREVNDSSGVARARYDFDSWGRQTKIAGDLESDFGYTGFYVNKASGLDLTRYRAYDPEKGRWLNRDPLGEASGFNRYSYAMNSPGMYLDPTGLISLTYNAGFHIPVGILPVSVGTTIGSRLDNPTNPRSTIQVAPDAQEVVVGSYADIGVSAGLADFSGSGGKCAGLTLGFGLGRYGGVQITLNKNILNNIGSFRSSDYVDGVSFGLGFAAAISPVTGTVDYGKMLDGDSSECNSQDEDDPFL